MRSPQAFAMTSNYASNRVNAGAITFRRSFMTGEDLANTTPNINLNNFNLGRNGIDWNERMVEVRRSYVDPKRVEMKSRIDYLPVPKQTTLSLTEEIRVTEMGRTQEIVRTKIIQSPSPDDVTLPLNERLGRHAFEDQINHPCPFTQQKSFPDTRLQLFTQDGNSHHLGLNLDENNKILESSDRNIVCYHNNNDRNEPSMWQLDHLLDLDPISVYFDENPKERQRNSTRDFNYVNLTLQQPEPEPEPRFVNYLDLFPRSTSEDRDNEEGQGENDVIVGDGKTHSLPHEKYGPYTCPKCRGVFVTSQLFAAHMGSHYKFESKSERSRRRAAKNKSKNVHLLHSKFGMTVLPKSFKPSEAKKKSRKGTRWLSDEESSTEDGKEEINGENDILRLEGLPDVDVKPQIG